jgi:hypothetical protein
MPFTLSESVGNAAHRAIGLWRVLRGLRRDHFISKGKQSGLPLKPLLRLGGQPVYCQLCGFYCGSIELNEQWLMESCSASGFKELANKASFAEWLARLSASEAGPKSSAESANLSPSAERSYTSY